MFTHNCKETQALIIDIIFGEIDPMIGTQLMIEINGCHSCLAEYQSMLETLRQFDQAAAGMMPDESYWPRYELALHARLQAMPLSWHDRLTKWLAGLFSSIQRPLPAVAMIAAVAAIILMIAWWRNTRLVERSINAPIIVKITPTPEVNPALPQSVTVAPSPAGSHRPRQVISRRVREDHRVEQGVVEISQANLVAGSFFTPEMVKHFEKAQLLLRSFRNVSDTTDDEEKSGMDLTYEKQLSRRLLNHNILLRRHAESKGNLPAEDALSSLEPFLLDIANLPDNPSVDDLAGIRERLQRKEMIASLSLYSTSRSLSNYQDE